MVKKGSDRVEPSWVECVNAYSEDQADLSSASTIFRLENAKSKRNMPILGADTWQNRAPGSGSGEPEPARGAGSAEAARPDPGALMTCPQGCPRGGGPGATSLYTLERLSKRHHRSIATSREVHEVDRAAQ